MDKGSEGLPPSSRRLGLAPIVFKVKEPSKAVRMTAFLAANLLYHFMKRSRCITLAWEPIGVGCVVSPCLMTCRISHEGFLRGFAHGAFQLAAGSIYRICIVPTGSSMAWSRGIPGG